MRSALFLLAFTPCVSQLIDSDETSLLQFSRLREHKNMGKVGAEEVAFNSNSYDEDEAGEAVYEVDELDGEEVNEDLAEDVDEEGGSSNSRSRRPCLNSRRTSARCHRRRYTPPPAPTPNPEYYCLADCHMISGQCDKCGKNRACCKLGETSGDGKCAKLTSPPRADYHVCRDTLDTPLHDSYPPNGVGDVDCYAPCGNAVGPCKFCGPFGSCDKVGSNHQCRRPDLPPSPPPSPLSIVGEWEFQNLLSSGGASKTRGSSYSESSGTERGRTTYNEFTTQVSTGFWSSEVSFSATTGSEVASAMTSDIGTESYSELTANFAIEYGDAVYQWLIYDVASTGAQRNSSYFAQTQGLASKPACLPGFFITETQSSTDEDHIDGVTFGQICNYGYRLDGTGGDSGIRHNECKGRRVPATSEQGVPDVFRGYYDVSGCGVDKTKSPHERRSWDYCRWTGTKSHGDPHAVNLNNATGREWKCLLSNGDDVSAVNLPGWNHNVAGPGEDVKTVDIWERGPVNTNVCSTSAPTQSQCLEAARQSGETTGGLSRRYYRSRPSGCSVNVNNKKVYWNYRKNGKGHKNFSPVCAGQGWQVLQPDIVPHGIVDEIDRGWNFMLFQQLNLSPPHTTTTTTTTAYEVQLYQIHDITIGSHSSKAKCVMTSGFDASHLVCPPDAGDRLIRVNDDTGNDAFRVNVTNGRNSEICVEKLISSGWSQNLRIRCWILR